MQAKVEVTTTENSASPIIVFFLILIFPFNIMTQPHRLTWSICHSHLCVCFLVHAKFTLRQHKLNWRKYQKRKLVFFQNSIKPNSSSKNAGQKKNWVVNHDYFLSPHVKFYPEKNIAFFFVFCFLKTNYGFTTADADSKHCTFLAKNKTKNIQ